MKNKTTFLVPGLLALTISGSAHADTASTSKTAPAAPSPSQYDQSAPDIGSGPIRLHPRFYVPTPPVSANHKAGLLGANRPLFDVPTPPVSTDEVIDVGGSDAFCQKGEAEISKGNWHAALQDFQQALSLYAEDRVALYGKAQCIAALGDAAAALKTYRSLIYTNDPSRYGLTPGDGFQENNVPHLMQFALLLNKTGQTAEALSIYNRAAYLLDYQDSQFNGGKPHLKVLLPELVEERLVGNQVRYTPERLQALAEAAIAHESSGPVGDKEAVAQMQEAVKLYPDSVPYYYLGEALLSQGNAGAKAAYQKAVQLGDDQTVTAAKEKIVMCR